ncbi:hypothetical protein ABFS82_14G065300 [Erythranthe guttata]|uniref:transcription repressor OFP17-like n=1 Tax=Erythranthe guttata TaxID=4155 RepID=UPI00064D73FF|nr:PREDICTED: transcription repressor OFP17-like [Erythranthe guttata]|eukprot:XP_012839094.1 PREDICTED: transcription repressor OFP17-like [Erythranthe guttata]
MMMALSSFKRNVYKPCKKILHLFRFRLHKPVFVKSLHNGHRKPRARKTSTTAASAAAANNTAYEGRFPKILSVLHSLRRNRDQTDRVSELKSFSDAPYHREPYPSPITPAYIRLGVGPTSRKEAPDNEEEEEDDVAGACRSFEKHLIEMVVEEGKMGDLVDVEELLYYWKNLKSPVFADLVGRFYGELCQDLFFNASENYDETPRKGLLR